MKLVYFLQDGRARAGVLADGRVLDLTRHVPEGTDLGMLMTPEGRSLATEIACRETATTPLSGMKLLSPIGPNNRVFCIGVNYKSHIDETGREMPPRPSSFIRTHQSLVPPGAALLRPKASVQFDYEGELAIVIGKTTRNVPEAGALACVGGYTCFNDGSVRDYQKFSVTAGKNFDSSGSCGPWIVTADEIPDPTALTLTTRLNGQEVQRSGTDLLIYSVPLIISFLSEVTELQPGDVIATGTPAGVGSRRTPPLWMKAGDEIEVEITGIGVLKNVVEDQS